MVMMTDNLTPYDEYIKKHIEKVAKEQSLVLVKIGVDRFHRQKKYNLFEFSDGTIVLVPQQE